MMLQSSSRAPYSSWSWQIQCARVLHDGRGNGSGDNDGSGDDDGNDNSGGDDGAEDAYYFTSCIGAASGRRPAAGSEQR
jgi:hypothetical protein